MHSVAGIDPPLCLFTRLGTKAPRLLEVTQLTNTKMLLWAYLKRSLLLGLEWALLVYLFIFRVNALQQCKISLVIDRRDAPRRSKKKKLGRL